MTCIFLLCFHNFPYTSIDIQFRFFSVKYYTWTLWIASCCHHWCWSDVVAVSIVLDGKSRFYFIHIINAWTHANSMSFFIFLFHLHYTLPRFVSLMSPLHWSRTLYSFLFSHLVVIMVIMLLSFFRENNGISVIGKWIFLEYARIYIIWEEEEVMMCNMFEAYGKICNFWSLQKNLSFNCAAFKSAISSVLEVNFLFLSNDNHSNRKLTHWSSVVQTLFRGILLWSKIF